MSVRLRTKSKHIFATLVTGKKAPCAFCQRKVDDEITYGKLYAIGDIQCHYFCALLSCCLVQKGKDAEGLFGFLYDDILAEIMRSKKHRCSYCGRGGAGIGCCISQCRKQFHLPCGRERSAVSLFYGNYKSFCQDHAPKQKVPEHIMSAARLRRRAKLPPGNGFKKSSDSANASSNQPAESVCVICYEAVDGFPTLQTFWPPCCARDAWFHRTCLQRMALSAGVHYLKCPLCNDKENFREAVVSQGYYVPDRDAAWELEQNAFAEMYERPSCGAEPCLCPLGRGHDAEAGMWDIKLCILCGTSGLHAQCMSGSGALPRHVCAVCRPTTAPKDLEALAISIEALVSAEQSRSEDRGRRGPVMPSRMSLRRTKQRVAHDAPSTSRSSTANIEKTKTSVEEQAPPNTITSRLELNLKTPRKPSKPHTAEPVLTSIENNLLSPVKLLEQSLKERIRSLGVKETELDSSKVFERVRDQFKKPRPLRAKIRIVNDLLDDLFECMSKEKPKTKEPILKWNSPKKCCDIERVYTIIEIPPDDHATSPNKHGRITNPLKTKTKEINYSPKKATEVAEKSEEGIEDTTEAEDSCENNATAKEIEGTVGSSKENNINDAIAEMEDIKPAVEVSIQTITEVSAIIIEEVIDEKDSSTSTFQLPHEFTTERDSDDEVDALETPKKLRIVEFEKDSSLEISENNAIVNIDVIKMADTSNAELIRNLHLKSPINTKACAFEFSPVNKEALQKANVDIDMESFQNRYLDEVGEDFKCEFNHKHKSKDSSPAKLRSAIDFALKAYEEEIKPEIAMKRKLITEDVVPRKKKRKNKRKNNNPPFLRQSGKKKVVVRCKQMDSIQVVCSQEESQKRVTETVDLTLPARGIRKSRKSKRNARKSRRDIQVKIKWKKEQLNLKISKTKRLKKRKEKKVPKALKQYVLQYPAEMTSADSVIVKPESDLTPVKRKYEKHIMKIPDKFKQTSILSFFQIKAPE